MIEIKLWRNYYLRADEYQWILSKRAKKDRSDGTPYYHNLGYYTNFRHLIKRLIDHELRNSNCKTIDELENKLNELRDTFANDLKLNYDIVVKIKCEEENELVK